MRFSDTRLIFVYNADSGLLNAVKDALHKAVSPSSYPCRLCGLTFGSVRMKSTWRRFIEGLGLPVEFLHRDEFLQQYHPKDVEFPSAYMENGGDIRLFISRDALNSTNTLEELMEMVKVKVEEMVRLRNSTATERA